MSQWHLFLTKMFASPNVYLFVNNVPRNKYVHFIVCWVTFTEIHTKTFKLEGNVHLIKNSVEEILFVSIIIRFVGRITVPFFVPHHLCNFGILFLVLIKGWIVWLGLLCIWKTKCTNFLLILKFKSARKDKCKLPLNITAY